MQQNCPQPATATRLASRQWLLFIPYLFVQVSLKHAHWNFTSRKGNQWLQLQNAMLLARDEERTIRCWMTASEEESQLKASKPLGKLLPGWLRPYQKGKASEQCAQQIKRVAPSTASRSCRSQPPRVPCKRTLVRTHAVMCLWAPLLQK